MRRVLFLLAMCVLWAAPVRAQDPIVNYAVALYPSTATDPNVDTPVASEVAYLNDGVVVRCGQPKVAPPPVVTNPTTFRVTDPADTAVPPTTDCLATVTAQLATLPAGSYKAAVRANSATMQSPWSAFSNVFRVGVAPRAPLSPRVR